MNDEHEDAFETRLRALLASTEFPRIPALTPERMDKLRALIPSRGSAVPRLSLMWKNAVDGVRGALSLVEIERLFPENSPVVLLRDGEEENSTSNAFLLPLPDGELRIRVVPSGDAKAKLLLSMRGGYAGRDDVSVELSLGKRLIEARPLEQKAEFTLNGSGAFSVALFAGEDEVTRMELDIGEAKEAGHAE